MSKFIKLRKGFDINLVGKADKKIAETPQPETFALKPSSFQGILRPKVLVNEGDTVKAGTPILFDKKNERVIYTSPVSGEVAAIVRGEKRKLLEVRILADKQIDFESFKTYSTSDLVSLSNEEAVDQLLASGVWPNLIQRPFGIVADPSKKPKAIFISAFDSNPLAPDYDFMFKGEEQNFQAGIQVLKKLTSGLVHVNVNADAEISQLFSQVKGVQLNKFSGPHPAGNVGVQIHHLNPINKGEIVWTIKPYGVIQIGKLFLQGKYDASRMVAITGSEVTNAHYVKTFTGACINKFVDNNTKSEHVRYVAGNLLTGEKIVKDGYLGFFDDMVSVVPEGDYHELFGWILPTAKKLSFHRAFGLLSFLNGNKEYTVDTNLNGGHRAFVQTGAFEKVLPMDILPTYLLKAILAEDFDEMESLGLYEVIEEDLALCEFIDVSKNEIQSIVRTGLDLLHYS